MSQDATIKFLCENGVDVTKVTKFGKGSEINFSKTKEVL